MAMEQSVECRWVSGRTRVQIRTPDEPSRKDLRCRLVYGQPDEMVSNRLGQVALFGGGQIVAYLIEHGRVHRFSIFRTLELGALQTDSVKLLGVWPRVRLLAGTRSKPSIEQMWRLFGRFRRRGVNPSRLSDEFWVRVGCILGGREMRAILEGLMRHEDERS